MNEGRYREDGAIGGRHDVVGDIIRAAGKRTMPSAEATALARAAVTATWERKTRGIRRRRQWLQWGAVAAALVLAIGVWTRFPGHAAFEVAKIDRVVGELSILAAEHAVGSRPTDGTPILAGSMLRTGAASYAGLRLDDGTSLRLGALTEVMLAGPDTVDLIAGKVYVDKQSGKQHEPAIEVRTPRGVFRDIGTQFEVKQSEDVTRLRVREGIVTFTSDGVSALSNAGEEVIIDASGAISRSRISRSDPAWDWTTLVAPTPELSHIALDQLLRWVNRESGRDIRFENAAAKAQAERTRLHGRVDRLSPLEALDVMLATTDLTYELLDDGSIVIRLAKDPGGGTDNRTLRD
jgi:ferric-dicitrate binding protein FerR (iron transport regulator)